MTIKTRTGIIEKLKRYFFSPCPSLFDVCACIAIAGIGFVPAYLHGFYFCFAIVFIASVGFSHENTRSFSSAGLSILVIMALSNIFIHSFVYSPRSITFQYLNFYLMFEGFAYLFFGVLLLLMLIAKTTNFRILYLALPFSLYPSIVNGIQGGRGSLIFAMAMGFIIFLSLRKRYTEMALIAMSCVALLFIKHDWFAMKFSCRIPLWIDMFKSCLEHPIIGHGFNKLLTPDNMKLSLSWGSTWLFIHNDYLNAMNIFGFLVIVPITMFLYQVVSILRRSWYIAPVIGIIILCFFQMTMFDGNKALSIIACLALAITERES